MTEISRRLQGARELAGLSIEDLAATTKIRRAALQAIERGEFDRLPGDFYTRAFLKAYAREVHLSPNEIVHEYDLSRPGPQPQPEMHEIVAARRHARQTLQAAPAERAPRAWNEPSPWPLTMSMSPGARATVAIATTVLLLIVLVRNRPADERPHEPGAVGTSGVAEAAATPVDAAPRAGAAPIMPDKLILDIRPAGPTWVTGAADGKRVLYRLLSPGEHITVEARDDLSFRIGNAVAFAYAINGLPGKPLGGPDEIREFRITRENYRSFGR